MQGIVQVAIEVARVLVQATAVARTDNNDRMKNTVPKIGRPVMQQPAFNWKAEDKYSEFKTSYKR